MENTTPWFDYSQVIWKRTLNTFQLWTWLHHWEPLSSVCPEKIDCSEIDTPEWLNEVFSLENRKEAWGEKYRETNNITTTRLDWKKDEIKLPSIWWGWMWMDVSSLSLLEATSELWPWITSHLSSIWTSNFRKPNLFEDDWKWFDRYWEEIEKIFYYLFWFILWLTDEQIENEFLKVDESINLDSSFQPVNKAWRLFLMNDLIELYNDIKKAKDKWLFVPVNHMYKSTWYVASIKIAALAWADAITTWAWIPRNKENNFVHPRDIVSNFYRNIWKNDLKMPAFWLIVSLTMAYAPWYDYYIDEDPRNAGWHQWATEWMLPFEKRVWKKNVLDSLRNREWITKNTPIYAWGWINSASDIKEMFDMWFDWIQLWTNLAVSEEARNWEWEDFKNALISWNHFWEETEIDEIAKNAAEKLKLNIEKELEKFRKKFDEILWVYVYKKLIKKIDDWNYNVDFFIFHNDKKLTKNEFFEVINAIENQIFNKWTLNYLPFNDTQISFYNFISEKIFEKYDGDIDKLRKDLRLHWNLLKAHDEFENFGELWKIPTHILFDSVVWFIWRMRIEWWEHRLMNWTVMKQIKCVQCVTHCVLTNRWWGDECDWTRFCIRNSLHIWNRNPEKDLIVNFTWTTTPFYPEIRPVKDIIAAYMWVEIVR